LLTRKFALKIGDIGYNKLGDLVAKETILTKIGTIVTRLPVLDSSAALLQGVARSEDAG